MPTIKSATASEQRRKFGVVRRDRTLQMAMITNMFSAVAVTARMPLIIGRQMIEIGSKLSLHMTVSNWLISRFLRSVPSLFNTISTE